eukprot:TRINITY_DN11015_c0_g1_i1.p1 TRINITY_DN11015_c0_g1~~TRINITY_DN11015_c0_g1_i1.p1  ORF type:complete len:393 (-),score=39.18 TRINITY_DN11015_c0_g1_i1:286-1464(-)
MNARVCSKCSQFGTCHKLSPWMRFRMRTKARAWQMVNGGVSLGSVACETAAKSLRPVPYVFWMLGGLAMSFSIYKTVNRPVEFDIEANPDFYGVLARVDGPRLLHIQEVMRQCGVTDPDSSVVVLETLDYGPTMMGTSTHSVMFLPKVLIDSALPPNQAGAGMMVDFSQASSVVDGDGEGDLPPDCEDRLQPVELSELTEAQRNWLLQREGTILPNTKELDFIIGHECGHIVNHDTITSAVIGAGSLLLAHATFRLYRFTRESMRFSNWKYLRRAAIRLPHMSNPTIHLLSMVAATIATVCSVSWLQEFRADMHSARHLKCADVAEALVDKKICQNFVTNELEGGHMWNITGAGNDITMTEHCPLTVQKKYLGKLARDQKEERGKAQESESE